MMKRFQCRWKILVTLVVQQFLTMNARLQRQLSTGKHKILMCGFGVGLSWASAIMEVGDMVVPDIMKCNYH